MNKTKMVNSTKVSSSAFPSSFPTVFHRFQAYKKKAQSINLKLLCYLSALAPEGPKGKNKARSLLAKGKIKRQQH